MISFRKQKLFGEERDINTGALLRINGFSQNSNKLEVLYYPKQRVEVLQPSAIQDSLFKLYIKISQHHTISHSKFGGPTGDKYRQLKNKLEFIEKMKLYITPAGQTCLQQMVNEIEARSPIEKDLFEQNIKIVQKCLVLGKKLRNYLEQNQLQ